MEKINVEELEVKVYENSYVSAATIDNEEGNNVCFVYCRIYRRNHYGAMKILRGKLYGDIVLSFDEYKGNKVALLFYVKKTHTKLEMISLKHDFPNKIMEKEMDKMSKELNTNLGYSFEFIEIFDKSNYKKENVIETIKEYENSIAKIFNTDEYKQNQLIKHIESVLIK